jgi:hypothetical protein
LALRRGIIRSNTFFLIKGLNMKTQYSGIVKNGQIRLKGEVQLPENTKVLVLVSNHGDTHTAKIVSPRLVNPEQAKEFQMEVMEEAADASV